jgi:hypothetical protein
VACLPACTAAIPAEEMMRSFSGTAFCLLLLIFLAFVSMHCNLRFRQTRINDKMASLEASVGFRVRTHGDSAYPVLSNTAKGGGYQMSKSRICVEWGFGKVCSLWAGIDYHRKMQIYLNAPGMRALLWLLACARVRARRLTMPAGRLYVAAALLTNMHTILYGSGTSKYFGCRVPFTLEEYMNM